MNTTLKTLSASLVLLGLSSPSFAVTYAITTFDLNNGVGVSSSASYKLSAAVGDTFLGGAMSGGNYSLKSGLIAQVDIPVPKSSATTLNFGNQGISVASTPLTVTINNYGASVLNVSSITPTGDFAVTASNCTAVASNGSCNVDVRFTPTLTGARTGTLTFAANAAISSVALSGTGVLNTQTITFGSTPSIKVGGTVTLTATASSNLAVTLASTTPTFCTVSGNTVTGVSAGTCSITATQAGNGTYAAASNSLSFAINSATQVVADGDAPLPAWMLWLLGSGLVSAMMRRRRA